MELKEGASVAGVCWQMFQAALIAEEVYKKLGAECVITAGTDGKHMNGSLHYEGRALDLRTRNIAGRELQAKVALQQRLGKNFDVVIEADHIHLEYDPKP